MLSSFVLFEVHTEVKGNTIVSTYISSNLFGFFYNTTQWIFTILFLRVNKD